MTAMVSHTRIFSELDGYQAAHTLTYSLREEQGVQRLTLCRRGSGGCRTESALAAVPFRQAQLLVCYLYENAVPLESWLDILEDLLPQGALKRE